MPVSRCARCRTIAALLARQRATHVTSVLAITRSEARVTGVRVRRREFKGTSES